MTIGRREARVPSLLYMQLPPNNESKRVPAIDLPHLAVVMQTSGEVSSRRDSEAS